MQRRPRHLSSIPPTTRPRWRRAALAGVLVLAAALGISVAVRHPAHTRTPDSAQLAVITPIDGAPPLPTGNCGPSRRVGGVPLGWAPSRSGAVAAAAGYAKTISTLWFLTDRDRRHQAIRLLATPDRAAALTASQDRLAGELGALFGGGSEGGAKRTVLATALLGYRVDSFTGAKARVALWAVVVHGSQVGPSLAPAWTTSTLDLEWIGGDWKLTGATTAPGPGPVAQTDAGPGGAPMSLLTTAATFREFTDVPK